MSSSGSPRSTSSRAQLEAAQWNLDKTIVRAPADGYVTNLALRKGARVANLPLSPVMAFIDTSDTLIGVEIAQIDARYIAAGQPVEVTFKFEPGHDPYRQGRDRAAGDLDRAGADVRRRGGAEGDSAAPFVVRVRLDDEEVARRLPAGATGTAAIYTEAFSRPHHPKGAAAADRDPELRQSVLRKGPTRKIVRCEVLGRAAM